MSVKLVSHVEGGIQAEGVAERNGVLTKMFGPNRAVEKTTRRGALMICTLHQIPG
jgi:hypothetical protein